MTPGWAAFVGVICGGVITGAFMLLADWFKHLRLRKERMQDLLIDRRVKAYSDLNRRLTELWWDLPLVETGLEPLRWPKDKRISPKFYESAKDKNTEEKKDLANRSDRRLEQLKEFVHAHGVVLAPSVQRVFWQVFGEFTTWRNMLNTYTDEQLKQAYPDYFDKIKKAFNELRDRTSEAIMGDLGVQGFDIPDVNQIRAWAREGKRKIRLAKRLKEPGGGSPQRTSG